MYQLDYFALDGIARLPETFPYAVYLVVAQLVLKLVAVPHIEPPIHQ